MAEKKSKLKNIGRSASTESTEYSLTMGKSVRRKKPKERWLLSRKTWRYMTDAGRRLIPDGAKNCPEDIPKIEAYFQEVCKREPKFLLWRKNSYPGALGFKKKRKQSRKGGSCRKAVSENEVDLFKPERPKDLILEPKPPGRFDLKKMKDEFLNSPPTPTDYSRIGSPPSDDSSSTKEETQLVNMLEQYLKIADVPSTSDNNNQNFNYQELIDKLQRHLTSAINSASSSRNYSNISGPSYSGYSPRQHVHFQGDHVQRTQWDTLSRYFSQCSNRDKIISDLLTDRKALEKLYFELRKARNFKGARGDGSSYRNGTDLNGSINRKVGENNRTYHMVYKEKSGVISPTGHPPPLIEVESETIEITFKDWGTQTMPVPENVLQEAETEYKKVLAEQKEEEERELGSKPRRRSSVDHDDVSQSVSDTIKRYLRMARKKSADGDKADRFKRVNYDRNLRNIKAKGEITKPGDDDGLNKGCQTNDDWILTYRDLKMGDQYDWSDLENQSRVSSTRSSIDGIFDGIKSNPSSPPSGKSGSHSFLSQLLHGKHDKQDKSMTANSMQKSKSSSSVMQQGSRLVAKKIFRSRSKSQTRPAQTPCSWTPRGSCVWNSITGRQVILNDTNLLHLTEIERKVLQKVAIAKLQALNLGCTIKVPIEHQVGVPSKSKRRPYLLRKAKTTGNFDAKKASDKEGTATGGLVFGIPLNQCVENDRIARTAAGTGSPLRSRIGSSGDEQSTPAGTIGRRGSRTSFSSLIDSPREAEVGSCESLQLGRMVGSVPGLLDALSCGSVADLPCAITTSEEESSQVPNVLTECIRHLENHGLHTSGIFRVSASKKRLRQLREDFDCGKEMAIDEDQCVHDVANLMKEYLRDLPDPLLCRDLYHAFVQTQRIRNRRLQLEALQHLVQLLPPANRDTLYALLSFLASVARNASDGKNSLGEEQAGNKMDSNNLATVFAPNILHSIKPGAKDVSERAEDRLDVINVVRSMIDHFQQIFVVPATLLDEVYIHMMDLHPEILDKLLTKLDSGADESVEELDSECNSAPWTPTTILSMDNAFDPKVIASIEHPKRTYSREECLHEMAATGGPNVGMRIRHKDRIKKRSLLSKIRNTPTDEDCYYQKNRSSSLESTSSHTESDIARALRICEENGANYERRQSSPYITDSSGVLTASLTIPVHQYIDDDIPFIEDGDTGRQQLTLGVVRVPTAPPRKRNTSVGSDSSVSSIHPITASLSLGQGHDSALGSTATYSSSVQNTPTSVSSSVMDPGIYSSPPSWTSSPPTSPTSLESARTSVSYTEEVHVLKPAPKGKSSILKDSPTAQKVSFATTIDKPTTIYQRESSYSETKKESKYTPTISSIGNAVLRSKTADFERISKTDVKVTKQVSSPSNVAVSSVPTVGDKKKYTKRRYTDTRHPTQHIPDSESLDSGKCENKPSVSPTAPVYKRRELISSAHKK